MKLPKSYKIETDKNGRQRIVVTINPKLDASAKIRQRTSTKQRVVKRSV